MAPHVRMDDHIQIPLFLSNIATICFFLLTTLPQSHSDTKFSDCSRTFNCGVVSNISYPFWGQNRPRYCGGSHQFKLNCHDNEYTSIQIASQNFRVQNINAAAYTMTMRQEGGDSDACSPQLTDTILNSSLFRYPQTVHNITVFYICPSEGSIGGNNYRCPNDGNIIAFYVDVNETVLQKYPGLKECKRRVIVPALLDSTLQPLEGEYGYFSLLRAVEDGFEVNYSIIARGQECRRCQESIGSCGTNDTANYQFSCHCPDGSDALQCSDRGADPRRNQFNWERNVIIGVTGAAIAGLLTCITFCYFRCKSSTWQGKFWLTRKIDQDIEAFLKNHRALAQKRYKFSDVKKMTNSFKVKLGQGGFGAVYKGYLPTGCPVAVKILNASKENGEEFINEVATISRTSHVNVVSLLGFCLESGKRALIYEFMPNGSLEKFIYKKEPKTTPSLSWEKLYQIATGIAHGLEYLHRGCSTRILHFDIKPHNILLDENFCPKISDFGLAKLCPKRESIISMSDARGTMGYVAPEVWNRHFGGVSHKSDVYSYGMMLLEMVGGRKNVNAEASHTSEIYFPHWVYNRLQLGSDLGPDSMVATEENEIAKRMTMVGLWCIQTIPNDRPTISRAIDMLKGSMNSIDMPPKPVLSSPTRSAAESSITLN